MMNKPTFYEFFAGGGMARAGLGAAWRCLFANDFDMAKASAYRANWGDDDFRFGDINALSPDCLPEKADLAWASFPCQDLSLAGRGKGLEGGRSGAFWGFARLMKDLRKERRQPRLLVLENVTGLLTSSKGLDFQIICSTLAALDYRIGALMIDAAYFLPQSRPRLFIVAVGGGQKIAPHLIADAPSPLWASKALLHAQKNLPEIVRQKWVWWSLPQPAAINIALADLIEDAPADVPWRTLAQTQRMIAMMSGVNSAKLTQAAEQARTTSKRAIGAIYRRTRRDAQGARIQRAEVRFDGMAGCLRTPTGGSSRQFIISIDGEGMRTRLLSGREAARLMGLPDDYRLPTNYNDAYRLAGDGLAVPVVRYLSAQLLLGLLGKGATPAKLAARKTSYGEIERQVGDIF